MQSIHFAKGCLTVAELTKCYGISERQLQQRFKQAIGVSARHYIKTIRFQEALSLLKFDINVRLTEVAYALDYADQAHFIKHVKQLSELSPKALHRKLMQVPVNQRGNTPYLVEELRSTNPKLHGYNLHCQ